MVTMELQTADRRLPERSAPARAREAVKQFWAAIDGR
jgi:hypothetical protein